MEVILASAFGVQVGIQTSDDELYTSNAEKLFQQPGFSFVLSKSLQSPRFQFFSGWHSCLL